MTGARRLPRHVSLELPVFDDKNNMRFAKFK